MIPAYGNYVHIRQNVDWSKLLPHEEDICQIEYQHCLIDLGWYSHWFSENVGAFVIYVIAPRLIDGVWAFDPDCWEYPLAIIPCPDEEDVRMQFQRAVEVYPILCR
jgi:hypothetical protein